MEARGRPLPNILVILVDDLAWRDIGPSVPTPNIDALAESGVTFSRAYAFPFCSPSRCSLLFGIQPFREDLGTAINPSNRAGVSIPLSRVALPQILNGLGYETLATGKWHLNTTAIGLPQFYDYPRLFGFRSFRAGWMSNLVDYFEWMRIDDGVPSPSSIYNTTAIREATVDWWQATAGPKFAYVALHAAHSPYHLPPAELLPPGYSVGPGNRGLFEAMIVAMDTEIGHLMSAVDLRSTLVFFISDNGTPLNAIAPGQEGSKVKGSVYEEGINVPFIAAGWGAARNRASDALISTTDLFATILDVLKEPSPAGHATDSVSFAPLISQPELSGRTWVYSQKFAPNGPGPYTCNTKAVVTERYKLLVTDSREFVFDLVNDPTESNPLKIFHENQLIYRTLRGYMDSMEALGAP